MESVMARFRQNIDGDSDSCEAKNQLTRVRSPGSTIRLITLTWLSVILLGIGLAVPARAQYPLPGVDGFSNDYPWFNEVPRYSGVESFQYFLAYHPQIARMLSRNPRLLYDSEWRSEQPALEQYLDNHPYVWRGLNGPNWAEGPVETQWGDYDDEHQWRDAYWWHRNDPNEFYDTHRQWASLDARWLNQDGAYDNQHQWHYGEWWYNQNPSWVSANHPQWLQEHRNWSSASEQQKYRRSENLGPGGPNSEQQASIDRRSVQQQQLNQQYQRNAEQQQKTQQEDRRKANAQYEVNAERPQSIQDENQGQGHENQENKGLSRQQGRDGHDQNQQHATEEQARADAHAHQTMQPDQRQESQSRQEHAQAMHQEHPDGQEKQNDSNGGKGQH